MNKYIIILAVFNLLGCYNDSTSNGKLNRENEN